MEESSQKTVVAFIAGLLIGGLLVWVFSLSPDKTDVSVDTSDVNDTEEGTGGATTSKPVVKNSTSTSTDKPGSDESDSTVVARGAGSVVVEDQDAGSKVTLGAVTMPLPDGWIAVHEMNGTTRGNILGAARYSESIGLKPTTIELQRATVKGNTYQVVVYGSNGDRLFDKTLDGLVTTEGGGLVEDSFTAK